MEDIGQIINYNKSAAIKVNENDLKKGLSLLLKAEALLSDLIPH